MSSFRGRSVALQADQQPAGEGAEQGLQVQLRQRRGLLLQAGEGRHAGGDLPLRRPLRCHR